MPALLGDGGESNEAARMVHLLGLDPTLFPPFQLCKIHTGVLPGFPNKDESRKDRLDSKAFYVVCVLPSTTCYVRVTRE